MAAASTQILKSPALTDAMASPSSTTLTYAVNHSSSTQQPATAQAARTGRHIPVAGRTRGRKSLAAKLALLTELHGKGALSDEEFAAAKRRVLEG
jgi:hypothetical protein